MDGMEDTQGAARQRQRIIVVREKNERRHLDASTDEAWAKSALALLTGRFNEGYWYTDPQAGQGEWSTKRRKERDELLEVKEETLAVLPEGEQEDLRKKIANAKRDAAEDEKELQQYLMIKQVVETQDLSWIGKGRTSRPRAWALLEARSGYEYEGVGLTEIEAPSREAPSL
jgi:hypothetical protein